jgi:hypothetical protein
MADSSDDEEPAEEEPVEEVPEVTKERFYQVTSDSFKDVFSDKTSDGTEAQFSLLSAFGRQPENRDSDEDMSGKFYLLHVFLHL